MASFEDQINEIDRFILRAAQSRDLLQRRQEAEAEMLGQRGCTIFLKSTPFRFHQHLFVGRLPIVTDHENTMSYQSHSDLYYEV